MNVVILSRGKFPGFDGPYRRTKLLGAGFVKNGCEVSLIVAYPPEWKKCDKDFYEKYGFRYFHTLKERWDDRPNLFKDIFHKIVGTFKAVKLFKKIHDHRKVDILFISGIGCLELLVALIIKKKYRVKIAIDKMDINYQFYKREKIAFLSIFANMSAREILSGFNIAVGEFFIKYHVDIVFTINSYLNEKYSGKIKGIVRMITPSLIESEAYSDDADLLHISLDHSAYKLLCVCVNEGYFYGLFPFIEALGNLKNRYKFRLYILGSERKDYLKILNRKLIEHGLHDISTILYKLSDEEVVSLYKNVDILLMAQANPKLSKGGFPSKISEYLISGKPIITTLFSDLNKYLENGKNCLIVPYGDIDVYEKALRQLFDSKELCIKLGEEAHKTSLEYFDYIKGTRKIIADMQKILFNA